MEGRGEPLMNGRNNYQSFQEGMDSCVHDLDGISNRIVHRCKS
jgi:hypothetical protein